MDANTKQAKENTHLQERLERLCPLNKALKRATSLSEKIALLDAEPLVTSYIAMHSDLGKLLHDLAPMEAYLLKAVIAIGQGPSLLQLRGKDQEASLNQFVKQLLSVERFYDVLGGIVGYHLTVLELLTLTQTHHGVHYTPPPLTDICKDDEKTRKAILAALMRLGEVAELLAVGGAGDRLGLTDPSTKRALPAAKLVFGGYTLLENLIRDVQAREYLHYKLFGTQVVAPIAMMSSDEKNNHQHILQICEENHWFGRPRHLFFLFNQPLAPLVSKEGVWCSLRPLHLSLKPGGHGVIWKLMQDRKVFDWLRTLNCRYALVHQINNPLASTDYGMLAFLGVGLMEEKVFGFCSCKRLAGSAEGMLVLQHYEEDGKRRCGITNVEYTEFAKMGIESSASAFPANTNILFANLDAVQEALQKCALPGLLINMKSQAPACADKGERLNQAACRLESTMQNIADHITDAVEEGSPKLRTYAVYDERAKIFSVAKNAYQPGKEIEGTPWGAFYDMQVSMRSLLVDYCSWHIPDPLSKNKMPTEKAPFVISLHPALGPLFTVIAQKLRTGTLFKGSELVIDATEVDLKEVSVDGSLRIFAEQPLGHRDAQGQIIYSRQGGKCTLHQVAIRNKGLDHAKKLAYWQGNLPHLGSLTIHIHGNGEFIAESVTFEGNLAIEVPEGQRMRATQDDQGTLHFSSESLASPSWWWHYAVEPDSSIRLIRKSPDSLLSGE